MSKIVLASASPRRKELLEQAGISFSVMPATGEEIITKITPSEVVENLSEQKAREVWDKISDEETSGKKNMQNHETIVVIGADTVVSYKNKILGKPKDHEDAVHMIGMLQGEIHQVYTGVTLLWRRTDGDCGRVVFHECTQVEVYPMSQDEIAAYVQTGEPDDKAGSYGIQGKFAVYVKEIHGDYNNVVGLPVARICQEMKLHHLM